MAKNKLKKLKKAVETVALCHTEHDKTASLENAFQLFNQETERLSQAYHELKEQFRQVSIQLNDSNAKLAQKVFELDIVTHYLHNIISNISQGILFIDLSGIITIYNPATEKILERDHLDILFTSFWENFSDEYFGFSVKQALKEKKAPKRSSCIVETPSGRMRELEIDIEIILHSEERLPGHLELIQGMVLFIRDLTEIRHFQEIAIRNERLKELGEMAALLAHEIRNPLGGIKGFASLLERDLSEQPRLKKMASYIINGTDILNKLMNNVLDFARPIKIQHVLTNLAEFILETKSFVLADSAFPKNIEFDVVIESEPMLSLDPQLIRTCLLNLIANSVQAMPNGGNIILKVTQNKYYAILQISDTGKGIPRQNIDKIFSLFFTTKEQGTGLGLPEVQKVIEAHSGTISVESQENEGATFTIMLPLKV